MPLKALAGRIPAADIKTVAFPNKASNPFYSSLAWRRLIAELIAIRGRVCEDPQHNYNRTHRLKNALPDSASLGRIYGDHIVELSDGGEALNPSNVRLLCAVCHGRKTAKEAIRRRTTTYKSDALPLVG